MKWGRGEMEKMPQTWVAWPGAFISKEDGCLHVITTNYAIAGPNDTFEVVIIPNDEVRCFYE